MPTMNFFLRSNYFFSPDLIAFILTKIMSLPSGQNHRKSSLVGVFLTTWPNAKLTKAHSFRLVFWRFCPLGIIRRTKISYIPPAIPDAAAAFTTVSKFILVVPVLRRPSVFELISDARRGLFMPDIILYLHHFFFVEISSTNIQYLICFLRKIIKK